MKVIRYKIFYSYRKFSLDNKDEYTADIVIALMSTVVFMYFTPLITILLKFTGMLDYKVLCWMVFGGFAFYNLKIINKKYRNEIHDAINYVTANDLRMRDKILIGFISFFSFPYLILTGTILKSMHIV